MIGDKHIVSEYIKKRIIKSLIDEVKCLGAVELELVGHKVIEIIENQAMVHHGLNKNYKPVGHTVDSCSNDSTIVGEYSTEAGYFEFQGSTENPSYNKINNDLLHAVSHKPPDGPERIYLICNQEEPPSFRARFNSTDQGRIYGNRTIIIDARGLAKKVYGQSIFNSSFADFYKTFFPGFSRDLENFEYFGKLPSLCDNYVRETKILKAVENHFTSGRSICVLHGLSGSGKTQSAIDFIYYKGGEYKNYIWISGEDWKPDSSLSSVQRTRGGIPMNVAGLFNSSKTILVIDSIERGLEKSHFEELSVGFEQGGIVLATSQLQVPNSSFYLSMPEFSEKSSALILGEDFTSISETCNAFIKASRFSPLILSITRNLADLEGVKREDVYMEILDDPEAIYSSDGVSIISKILEKIEPREREALKK